jgi:hypothetical protein
MIFRFLLFSVTTIFSLSVLAQSGRNALKNQLVSADSIVLLSHGNIYPIMIPDENGNVIQEGGLFMNGQINQEVVSKQKTLSATEAEALRSVLLQNKPPTGEQKINFCWDPHHSIFIYSNGLHSYVHLYFECRNYEVYGSLTQADLVMYKAKWKVLQAFF